jgi:hypothetical protein
MKAKAKIWALVLVLFLAAAGVYLANDTAELPRWVLGGGTSDSTTGGGTTLRATMFTCRWSKSNPQALDVL